MVFEGQRAENYIKIEATSANETKRSGKDIEMSCKFFK